jgi:hypothetical protein
MSKSHTHNYIVKRQQQLKKGPFKGKWAKFFECIAPDSCNKRDKMVIEDNPS